MTPERKNRHLVIVDNFDSFTFNLVDAFARQGCRVSVFRNVVPSSKILDHIRQNKAPGMIVLSPGPGRPKDAGCCLDLVARAKGQIPVLGICLGHQVILQEAGATIRSAPQIVHGKASSVTHDARGCFAGMSNPLNVGRYHSLAVQDVPSRFVVHAELEGMAMAVSDMRARQVGLQFHPESILTTRGDLLLASILRTFDATRPPPVPQA